MISLKNRLALTYALFTGLILTLLTLAANRFSTARFAALVRQTIAERSTDIVRTISEQYNPLTGNFNKDSIEAMGMFFVHEGYIVTVKTPEGVPVWDARSCDMEQCAQVIGDITERMEGKLGIQGALQMRRYPVGFNGRTVGFVDIETYGPFFYTEAETSFISSVNRLLITVGALFIILSAGVSVVLSGTLARPILKAGEAARLIARGNTSVRMPGTYRTRELWELSRSLNELAEELEEGERRQKQLTQDISHELRTPLACLQGTVEAMIDGIYEPDRERLEECRGEILRLTKLVEDLKTLTSFEWREVLLNKTDFDPARLVKSAAEPFIHPALEKGIMLRLELPEKGSGDSFAGTSICADYDRLKQVLINLLSNAVQYTDEGTITVRLEKREAAWSITVSDTGIGIAREELPRIFERLYRTDKSRSRNTGGAGIGLTIAAAIVRAHGGTISAESEIRRGSAFTLTLPG
ncbi:MAG: HAMP domain-containing histidine kinase [Treponema sp.]|jgi:signal transduction histidine kinase|nr:HAMP domain-containing histidine kinase [Treponema sp.]